MQNNCMEEIKTGHRQGHRQENCQWKKTIILSRL